VGGDVQTVLGLSSAPTFVAHQNFDGTVSGGTTGNANIFAVHFDSQELLFVFASGIASFSISGLITGGANSGTGDLSNIISFCDLISCTPNITGGPPPGETPVPAALPLFAGGLALFSLLRRRRKQTIESVLA